MRRRAGSLARALLRRARGDGASVARAPPRALAPASSPSRFLVPSSSSSRADRGASASASSFAPRLRGFAASARALLREHRDTRARVLSPEARLNQDIKACRAADDVLTLVARHGDRFNHVNVATAVNVLCKVTDARRDALNDDARYARLLSLVRARCREFRTREAASATHGLGILFAEKGAVVDADAADALVKVVLAHSASKRDMVPQAIANVLNAILKTDAFLRAVRRANANAVRPGGGRRVGETRARRRARRAGVQRARREQRYARLRGASQSRPRGARGGERDGVVARGRGRDAAMSRLGRAVDIVDDGRGEEGGRVRARVGRRRRKR